MKLDFGLNLLQITQSEIHPSTRDYFPVTITNSSLTTVDQALGLVKFNLEYTMANSIVTQSN